MQTVTSAANTTITGTADNDWISSSGDGVEISVLSGDDYVIARGQGSYIYGANGNDTLILLPPLSSTATSTSAARGSATAGRTTQIVSADTTVHGDAGNDDIMIVHDSAVVNGDAGDDYITIKLYESAGEFMQSLSYITLTGGDGNDTFSFNTSLPGNLETLTSVSGYRIEAVITDFSSRATFCYDAGSDFFEYSILTDSLGNYTDIVLRDDAERLSVTLQGVTDIEDIVYANAIKLNGDSIESTNYLGGVISNYGEDMSAIPEGITYSDFTVYVANQYANNVWLMGTDLIKNTLTYRNISAKTLDARNSTRKRTLVGNTRANVIYAGAGGDSLWGGNSANDTLYGNSARDMFFYGKGDGSDCIRNFVCGTASTSDVICFYDSGVSYTYRENNTIHVVMISGEELIVPLDYDIDSIIQYSTDGNSIGRAKVGNNNVGDVFTYNANTNIFIGGSSDNTLKVEDSRTNNIWFDGSYGQNFLDINVVDASTSKGTNQIAGPNDKSVQIIGGEGKSTLWGGGGYFDDTLTGGSGAETFWFGKYEGNDLIIGASDNDTINLLNITLNEVTSSESVSGGLKLNFENGAYSLTMQNLGSATFNLADGSSWVYKSNSWTAK